MKINGTLPINDKQQWVFMTLTVDGNECKFLHVAPANLTGIDLQDFVNGKEDAYRLDILKNMYPGAIVPTIEGNTPVQDFEAWIANGHKNTIGATTTKTLIPKVPWAGTHPPELNRISVLDFLKRFTSEEKLEILSSADPMVKVFTTLLSAASFVDFDDDDLQTGMRYLVALSMLTEARRVEILTLY